MTARRVLTQQARRPDKAWIGTAISMVANASPPRVGKSRVKSNSASVAQVSVTAEIEMPPKVAKRGPPPAWATRKPAHAGKTTHETRASAKNDNSFEGNRLRTMRNNPSSTVSFPVK